MTAPQTPISPPILRVLNPQIYSHWLTPPPIRALPVVPSLRGSALAPPWAEIDERPKFRRRRFKLWDQHVPPLRLCLLDPRRKVQLRRFQTFSTPSFPSQAPIWTKTGQGTPDRPPPAHTNYFPRASRPVIPLPPGEFKRWYNRVDPRPHMVFAKNEAGKRARKQERKEQARRLRQHERITQWEHERRFRKGLQGWWSNVRECEGKWFLPGQPSDWKPLQSSKLADSSKSPNSPPSVHLSPNMTPLELKAMQGVTKILRELRESSEAVYTLPHCRGVDPPRGRQEAKDLVTREKERKKRKKEDKERIDAAAAAAVAKNTRPSGPLAAVSNQSVLLDGARSSPMTAGIMTSSSGGPTSPRRGASSNVHAPAATRAAILQNVVNTSVRPAVTDRTLDLTPRPARTVGDGTHPRLQPHRARPLRRTTSTVRSSTIPSIADLAESQESPATASPADHSSVPDIQNESATTTYTVQSSPKLKVLQLRHQPYSSEQQVSSHIADLRVELSSLLIRMSKLGMSHEEQSGFDLLSRAEELLTEASTFHDNTSEGSTSSSDRSCGPAISGQSAVRPRQGNTKDELDVLLMDPASTCVSPSSVGTKLSADWGELNIDDDTFYPSFAGSSLPPPTINVKEGKVPKAGEEFDVMAPDLVGSHLNV